MGQPVDVNGSKVYFNIQHTKKKLSRKSHTIENPSYFHPFPQEKVKKKQLQSTSCRYSVAMEKMWAVSPTWQRSTQQAEAKEENSLVDGVGI